MYLKDNVEIKNGKERLKSTMLDYMPDASYEEGQVQKCMQIIDDFLEKMESSESKSDGMKTVEHTVLALNQLNEDCEGELIETDQREELAEIIILAGHLKGYNDQNDDITEDWREW